MDDFASWDEAREAEERWASRSSEYLPAELDPYAGELERNGSWRFEASAGYVWTPRVAWGWSPYTNGHWSWTPYGWTWVPYETWGWAPSHYGRWGFSASFGWYWAPGRTWGPGWVSWGVGGGYVGWCPLGYRDRPVSAWGGQGRGYAVPRGGGHGGWNVVREGDFGHRDVAGRRVPLAGIDPRSLQVADSARSRLTRDGRSLVAANPTARAISRRPTPGDFVRELAVDNKTTIPSPWLQRGRARAEEARARQSQDQATAARPRRGVTESGSSARGGSAEPERCRGSGALRQPPARVAERALVRPARGSAAGRTSRASMRFRPRSDADGSAAGARQRSRSDSRPRRDDSSAYRQQAPRAERPAPAREYSRSEARPPRVESSPRQSNGDPGVHAPSGGQRSSGEQRSGERAALGAAALPQPALTLGPPPPGAVRLATPRARRHNRP